MMRALWEHEGIPFDEAAIRAALEGLFADPALGRVWLALEDGARPATRWGPGDSAPSRAGASSSSTSSSSFRPSAGGASGAPPSRSSRRRRRREGAGAVRIEVAEENRRPVTSTAPRLRRPAAALPREAARRLEVRGGRTVAAPARGPRPYTPREGRPRPCRSAASRSRASAGSGACRWTSTRRRPSSARTPAGRRASSTRSSSRSAHRGDAPLVRPARLPRPERAGRRPRRQDLAPVHVPRGRRTRDRRRDRRDADARRVARPAGARLLDREGRELHAGRPGRLRGVPATPPGPARPLRPPGPAAPSRPCRRLPDPSAAGATPDVGASARAR